MVENDQAEILWDFQIQTDKLVMAEPQDIVLMHKMQKKAVVIDVEILSVSNIRKKEHGKLEKIPRAERGARKAKGGVKATVVPGVMGALGAATHKLGEWLQHLRSLSRRA